MEGKTNHFPIIDLLRGIAAFAVCCFHFTSNSSYYGSYLPDGNWFRNLGHWGWLGVEMFFVISGFVIPYSLFKSEYKISKIGQFLKKRWIRIEPPYIATILLILLNWKFNGWLWSYPVDINWKQVLAHLFYAPQFLGYGWINEIFWTLAIEFQYYVFISIFILGFINERVWIRLLTCGVFLVPFYFTQDNRLLTSYSSLFLMGIVTFWYKVEKVNRLLYLLYLLLLGFFAHFQFPNDGYVIPIITLFTSLVIAFVDYRSLLGSFMGKISYSLYLTHGLVGGNLIFFSMYIPWVKDNVLLRCIVVFIAIIVSMFCAWLFQMFIEGPSKRLSYKLTSEFDKKKTND